MSFPPPSVLVWIGIPALALVVAALVVFGFWYAAARERR